MVARKPGRAFPREEVEEFDRKLRRFQESLAHKERRMLREIIAASLEEDDEDVSGFLQTADDDALFRALVEKLVAA